MPTTGSTFILQRLRSTAKSPKVTILALNGSDDSSTDGVPCIRGYDNIKYLGVPFNRTAANDMPVTMLETKLFERFSRWDPRARTYRGRLQLLHTVILSGLWHISPHVQILSNVLARWLALLEIYLLTKRTDPTQRYIKLAKKSLSYEPFKKRGLQMPRISVTLQYQRLKLLQQLALLETDDP